MKSHVILLAGLAVLIPACAVHTTTVNGVTTVKFGAEAQFENLNELNERVNAARKHLLERFGDDPAKEAAEIASVTKELAAVREPLMKMKSNGAPWKSVDENLSDAENWNATTRAGLDAQLALKAMEEHVFEEPGPTAQQLDQTDATVKAFTTNVRKEWANVAESDTKRMRELRQNVAAGPELREKARAEAQQKAEAKAREDARRRAVQAINEGKGSEEQIRKRFAAVEVPSEAEVAALAASVEKVAAISPAEAVKGQRLLLDARIARALDADDPAPAFQALFQGVVATSGQSKGKALSVPLKVAKGHCVVWFGRYAAYTGSEKLLEDKVLVPGDATAAQRFTYWSERVGNDSARAFELRGLCATREVKATVSAKLEFTGTKNGVRYVALDFEKGRFPKELATKLELDVADHCDAEAWASMWLSPVPGSLGYVRGEPVIISQDSVQYAGGPGQRDRGYPSDGIVRVPPKAVKFTHQVQWARCDQQSGEAPASKAIKACSDRIEKRYEGQWKAIDRVRDVADGMSTSAVKFYSPAAEEKASRLRQKFDDDFARECQPLEDKAKVAFEKRFEKLVDQLTDTRPVDVLFDTAAK
jgi:hypothetical protein